MQYQRLAKKTSNFNEEEVVALNLEIDLKSAA